MESEKRKALERKLLRMFEEHGTKIEKNSTIEKGEGNIIRRRKGHPDKRLRA